jgi:hypothetical protein
VHCDHVLPPPSPLPNWSPVLPDGDLRAIWLHWTGADYAQVFPAYHFCLAGADAVVVHATHDLCANMRDVRAEPARAYAAHTAGRNSFAIGIAACGMAHATPAAFGAAPLTAAQCDALVAVSARLVRRYAIPLAAVRTHAEAAVDDGYFGAAEDQRWDIARIVPSPAPLDPREALATGDWFRERIGAELQRRAREGVQ